MSLECTVCNESTNQADGEYRELGDGEALVCGECTDLADRIDGGEDDSGEGVSTKYAT